MIGVGIVGAGHWGPNLIRNLHNRITSEVVWVADRDPRRLEQVQQRFPGMQTTGDVDKLLSDPRVAALVIATPTSTHHELTRAALLAGKDVLVEKPITSSSEQGEELIAVAAERQRILMVGHVFLFNGGVRRVKKYIDDGELGRIYYLSMQRTNLGPIRVDVNAAWDLASHDISIASYWLGAEPLSASAVGGSWINTGVEDTMFATLRYPNEVLVNLHVSWLDPRKNRDITVVGDRRMLTFDDLNLQEAIRIYDKGVAEAQKRTDYIDSFAAARTHVWDGDIIIPKVSLGEPLKVECDHFIECVAKRTTPLTDAKRAVGVVRALEAITRSAKAGGAAVEVRHA